MKNERTELSAFPLLQLGDVPHFPDKILVQAHQELSLMAHEPPAQDILSQYSQQQLGVIRHELEVRNALARLGGMLREDHSHSTEKHTTPTSIRRCADKHLFPSPVTKHAALATCEAPLLLPTSEDVNLIPHITVISEHSHSAAEQDSLNWQAGDALASSMSFVIMPTRPKRRDIQAPRKKQVNIEVHVAALIQRHTLMECCSLGQWTDPDLHQAEGLRKIRQVRREAALRRLEKQKRLRQKQKLNNRRNFYAPNIPDVIKDSVPKLLPEKPTTQLDLSESESVSGGDSTEEKERTKNDRKTSWPSEDEGETTAAPNVSLHNNIMEADNIQDDAKSQYKVSHDALSQLRLHEACTDTSTDPKGAESAAALAPSVRTASLDISLSAPNEVPQSRRAEKKSESDTATEGQQSVLAAAFPPPHEEASPPPVADVFERKLIVAEKAREAADCQHQRSHLVMDSHQRRTETLALSQLPLGPEGSLWAKPKPPELPRPDRVVNLLREKPEWVYDSTFPAFACILSRFYTLGTVPAVGPNIANSCPRSGVLAAPQPSLLPWDTQADVEQALEHQRKLYSTWSQVMADYATVFSPSVIADTELSSNKNALVYAGNPYALHYRVAASTHPEVCDIVSDVLSGMSGWQELPSDLGLKTTWNLLWTWSRPRIDYASLLTLQRVNHIPHSKQLTRKDLLKKHLNHYLVLSAHGRKATSSQGEGIKLGRSAEAPQDDFHIMPQTFMLPHEYTELVAAHMAGQREAPNGRCVWIMKPVGLSRGRGISLTDNICDIIYSEMVVVQRYIADPCLLDGYKFDLRLYVLVTSFQPLEAFIYRDGFCRLSTELYDLHDLSQRIVHLTNASIQRSTYRDVSADCPLRTAPCHEAGGSKVSLPYLWERLSQRGVDVQWLWLSIKTLVMKSLLCVEESIPHQPNAFELFGYDIILDKKLRPWLLEVNASPSMARSSKLDEEVKQSLIRDTIRLVDPLPFDRQVLFEVLQRRLGRGTSVSYNEYGTASTTQLHRDIWQILQGRRPRRIGQLPTVMGRYEPLAPGTDIHRQAMALKRRYVRAAPLAQRVV